MMAGVIVNQNQLALNQAIMGGQVGSIMGLLIWCGEYVVEMKKTRVKSKYAPRIDIDHGPKHRRYAAVTPYTIPIPLPLRPPHFPKNAGTKS